jgi:sugar phosphate isomerase/epimerase
VKPPYVSTTFLPDNTALEEALTVCREHEIHHVELGSNHRYCQDPLRLVKQSGLHCLVHNYFPIPREAFVMNIASMDLDIRQRSLDHACRALEFASDCEAPLYTIHPGFLTDPAGTGLQKDTYDFDFQEARLAQADYTPSFAAMLESLETLLPRARDLGVTIAIETQGSGTRPEHLLMQTPDEYRRLLRDFSPGTLGINLNVAHTRLASTTLTFSIEEFLDVVASHVVAMELSHNNGKEDQHLPLERDGWYWPLIRDKRFDDAIKILEFRHTHLDRVKENLAWMRGES